MRLATSPTRMGRPAVSTVMSTVVAGRSREMPAWSMADFATAPAFGG